jgi:AraC-like DNA-binding protein
MFRHREPSPPLRDFVELLWLYQGYSPGHARERLLPSGTVELVVNLRDDEPGFREPILAGPHSEAFILDTAHAASVIGAHFKPGGAFPFLGMPAAEVHNRTVSLSDLWGSRAFELKERILEAPSVDAKFDVLERALLRSARALTTHPAVRFALRELGDDRPGSVGEVTNRIGMSQRCFIERFKNEVGLTPKLFSRVRRFQSVISRLHGEYEVDWVEVALDAGYFDQAHFIHDFRAFSGLNPSAYLALQSAHKNHVPLPD